MSGFPFTAEAAKWEEKFAELRAYKECHDDCSVPNRWAENPPLGGWVNTQRTQKRKFDQGEPSQITQARIEKLVGIGFVWEPGHANQHGRVQ